jgi:uncharacterized integral membrane protein (TIGR00698 family)
MNQKLQQLFPGFLLSVVVGSVVMLLSSFLQTSHSILLGLLAGILINNFYVIPAKFQDGISFTSGKMLEISVVLLAFGINYTHIAKIGFSNFLIVILTVFLVLFFTMFLSKKMQCPRSVGWLVGFGTAICGSSAIAALAPTVAKDKEDIAVSMAVVNLYGTLGMLLLPLLVTLFQMSEVDASLLLGGTLHSVGNVAGAGYAVSETIGSNALTIKLARVAMLTPGLILFNYLLRSHQNQKVSYWNLPWYLIAFLVISTLVSYVSFPKEILNFSNQLGKVILTIAMVAIGLKIKFKTLWESGKRGLLFGAIVFGAMLIFLFTLLFLIN